jgi:hypothetical protein
MLPQPLGPLRLNARYRARLGFGGFDNFPRHQPWRLGFEQGRAGKDVKFGSSRAGIFVGVVFAALANVGQKPAQDRAMDRIVAVSAFPRLAALSLHGVLKCAGIAVANFPRAWTHLRDYENMSKLFSSCEAVVDRNK